MDTTSIVGLLEESLFMIVVFCVFLFFSVIRGRQGIINLILSLYFALLISLKFPYYGFVTQKISAGSDAVVMIVIFSIFTVVSLILFNRLIPRDEFETAFQGFGKKLLLALLATILVMIYSYHVLPVTEFLTPGSPIQSLFGPEKNFFWWLLLPLAGLFLL